MQKRTITEHIDKKIHKYLLDGYLLNAVQIELGNKIDTFMNYLRDEYQQDNDSVMSLFKMQDIEKLNLKDITKTRVWYINHCTKRIKDIDWLIKNQSKFTGYSNDKLFSLIKLKDKLQPE